MAHSNGIPVTPRTLFALPAVTDSVPRNAGQEPVTQPVTGPVTLPLTPLSVTGNTGETVTEPAASNTVVVPMTAPERARLAVTHWAEVAANGAGQLFFRPGQIGHVMWTGKPASIREHRDYIKSRAWVPPDLDGKAEKAVIGAGLFYHLLIGRPVKGAAEIVSAAAERPLRLTGLVLFLIALAVFAVPHIPLI